MKHFCTLLFLMLWFAVGAQQLNQRISVSIPATTLEAALKLVEQQSRIPISYELTRIKGIQVKAREYSYAPLVIILQDLLKGTQLEYKEKSGNILITARQRAGKTLSGFVSDAASGERLIGVSLTVLQRQAGTTTNNFGFYSITLPVDSLYLILSYTGYDRLDTVVALKDNTLINFSLQPANKQLEQITVTASRTPPIQLTTQMSVINLPVAQVRSVPRLLGEPDLMKTLQLMPGVKQGTEATSAILVRGGTPDQNLILLDGATLYNPMHLLGVFSTFNTSVLKDITLYKGAFPARYGGRLSSVVDISTKDGNMNELHGDFSIGLLSSQLTLEGPLKKGKTSFVLSGRRSYPDLFAAPIAKNQPNGPEKLSAFFYDINTKIHHKFSDKDKLYLSFYTGKDKFRLYEKYQDPEEQSGDDYSEADLLMKWGNIAGTLRWNHIFSPKLFSNTMLIGSSYKLINGFSSGDKYGSDVNTYALHLNSGIQDYGIKTDLDFRPTPAHTIKMGASYMYRIFTPGAVQMKQTSGNSVTLDSANNNHNISGAETDLYLEDDWEINRNLKLNAGVHWSAFMVQDQFYNSLQPRLGLRYLLPGDWALKASYTRMTQYLHLLSYNSISLPTDLWVPATKKIAPQQAEQFAVGVARNVFNNKYEFSIEGYYKTMRNVIEYKEGADYLTSSNGDSWQEQVAAGTGKSYGVELLMQKKTGRLTGWLGYTWAIANRKIETINWGRTFPYKYDRRHDLHLVAIYKLKKNVELSGSWMYQTAMPFTIPIAQYYRTTGPPPPTDDLPNVHQGFGTQPVDYINGRNNMRIGAYHRLDAGISWIKQKKNGHVRTWNISVMNMYNKLNPFFYYPKVYTSSDTETSLAGLSIMPVVPSVSYSLKF